MFRQGRVYLIPTRMGGYFNGLLFLLFLLSVGYSNNLLLIFTLILFGLNLLWVIQSHFYLSGLRPVRLFVTDGHALVGITFSINWDRNPENAQGLIIDLQTDKGPIALRLISEGAEVSYGDLVWPARGVYEWKRLKIRSTRPYGLYTAWKYVIAEGHAFAYPPLVKDHLPTQYSGLSMEGEVATGKAGAGDFQGFAQYDQHDIRRISWKNYAKSGELLVKEGEELKSPLAQFKWIPQTADKEMSLSILATQMVQCHRDSIPFTLEVKDKKLGPGVGDQFLAECLKELALC